MKEILILGAGRVGTLVAALLAETGEYDVHLADKVIPEDKPLLQNGADNIHYLALDATDEAALRDYCSQHPRVNALISCLPFFCNTLVAGIARECGLHYFDLTEDVETTNEIERLANGATTIFAPQCGLAPGFISIIANHLMETFDQVEDVRMRVGALPLNVSNALQYGLTWSTEGVVNEYAKPCESMVDGELRMVSPLTGIEEIKIDGLTYEAFNTSGGVGSMLQTYHGKVRNMNYKSIRHPGHGAKMRFMMHDMKMEEDLETMCRIMDNALPRINQDMVLIYVSIEGYQNGQRCEKNFAQKYPSQVRYGQRFSALQLTTATSACVSVDLALSRPDKYGPGFMKQESIDLHEFFDNRFGSYYKNDGLLVQAV